MAVIDELLVELGYEYDPEDLKQFQAGLDSTIGLVKKFVKAMAAGAAATIGFAVATTKASDEQGKLSDEIGVSVGQLDALQFANARAGGTADGLSNSLRQLTQRIGEVSRGTGSGLEAFGILGIQITDTNGQLKDTGDVLLEVADKLGNFSKAQQIDLAGKLGLSDTIRLLQQGSEGIKELTADAYKFGVTTEEDAIIAEEFQDSLVDIWQIVKQISRVITRALVPSLEDGANTLTEWWEINRDIIEQNIPIYIEKLTKALKFLTLAAVAFIGVKLLTTLGSLIVLMRGLTLSAMLANAAILLLPGLIIAGVAAIALLAQDAKVFFEGGDSFIGSMLEKYPQWAKHLNAIATIFSTLYDITMMVFDGWKMIFDIVAEGWGLIIDLLKTDITGNLKLVIKQLKTDFSAFVDGIKTKMEDAFSSIKDRVSDIFSLKGFREGISDAFDGVKDKLSATLGIDTGAPAGAFNMAAGIAAPIFTGAGFTPSMLGGNTSTSSRTTRFEGGINIEVNGSSSPEDTAAVIKRELSNLAQQTTADLNSPVRI